MVDSAFVTRCLVDLVRINSVNPSLESGGGGEKKIGEYIHSVLKSLHFLTSIEVIAENRINVYGFWKGKGKGKSLMLNAHMDTVGVQGMSAPFEANISDGKLFGRGSYDMKGSIAAMLGVAKAISDAKQNLSGDLMLTFVADEEYESIGTEHLLKKHKADACIVTEPTELQICLGHRGFGVYEISTKGVVAHGGLNKIGIDANLKMGKVLGGLNALADRLAQNPSHPLCGEASLHVPLIQGGQSLFIYSGKCTIQVERRTIPGETKEDVTKALQSILDDISAADKDFKADLQSVIWRNPYEISKDAPIVTTLSNNLENDKTKFIGHTWWEDSGLFGEAGIETVIIGPKGGGIHQAVEWVELDSVTELSKVLYHTTIDYCK